MNKIIAARFKSYQHLLVESYAVSHVVITRQQVTLDNGNIRIRANLLNGGLLELAIYIALDNDNQIVRYSYSFHWQDAQQRLIQRWDNAKHHPHLPHAPHHIHQSDRTIKGNSESPTLAIILAKIELQHALLGQRDELRAELDQFERQYGLESSEFHKKFKSGEMGDAMDFIEWYGAWGMYQSTLNSLKTIDDK